MFCLKVCNFIKRESNTGVFLWIFRNFLEHPFRRTSATNGCFYFFLISETNQLVINTIFFINQVNFRNFRRHKLSLKLLLKGESHIDFRTQCIIMTQIIWHPPHTIESFPDFWQNRYFSQKYFKCPWRHKG